MIRINFRSGIEGFKGIFGLLAIASLSVSCSRGFNQNQPTQQSLAEIELSSQSQNMGIADAYSIAFKQGQEISSSEVAIYLELTSPKINEIESIKMELNGVADQELVAAPFVFRLDLVQKTNSIPVKANAKFKNGRTATTQITVSPQTAGSGILDTNCWNKNEYDACIFWKSPVAQTKTVFSPAITFGQDLSTVQTYGIKLKNLTSQSGLQSKDLDIYASNGKKVAPDSAGSFKFKYADDMGKSFVAQLMAYFWLTEEIEILKTKSGRFYAEGKKIKVDAFKSSVTNNAYWDGRGVTMGVTTIPGKPSEVALGADVYMHELGHGNMQYAAGSTDYSSCKNADGCIGAINEGQADFHVALVFSQDPVIGQQFFNNLSGMPGRNVLLNHNLTGQTAFSQRGGEVHNMGSVYASLLWEMYSHPGMIPEDFAKMFSQHLAMLTNSSTIKNSRDIFRSIDKAQFDGKYGALIDSVYALKGYPCNDDRSGTACAPTTPPPPAKTPPSKLKECTHIVSLCEQAGFKLGDNENTNGVWAQCVRPLTKGKGVTNTNTKLSISATPEIVAEAKQCWAARLANGSQ